MAADTHDADVNLEAPREGVASAPPTGPDGVPSSARTWSMPTSPITRTHVEQAGRAAAAAAAAVVRAIVGLARFCAHVITQIGAVIREVPPALQLLASFGVLALLGVVGSIAASGTLGLVCAVVVVPICSIAVGALGHRWFTRAAVEPGSVVVGARQADGNATELERSMFYADRKLAIALNSLGSERHQQAVIALFQAKTAVELALGTENSDSGHGSDGDRSDAPIPVGNHRLRPRIQAGSLTKASMPESSSLAAS